jgi:hypothetical protein
MIRGFGACCCEHRSAKGVVSGVAMGRFLPAAWEFGTAPFRPEAFQVHEGLRVRSMRGLSFLSTSVVRLPGQILNPSSNQASRVTAAGEEL